MSVRFYPSMLLSQDPGIRKGIDISGDTNIWKDSSTWEDGSTRMDGEDLLSC
jgi:hypothetical protein